MSQLPTGPDDTQIPQMRWRVASKITLSIGSVLVVLALIVTIMSFVQVRQRLWCTLWSTVGMLTVGWMSLIH